MPTEFEIWGSNVNSDPIEDSSNQAGFEYYGNISPEKSSVYWFASPYKGDTAQFIGFASRGFTRRYADVQSAVAPAFAVK
jgi:hypothetical protein